MEEQMKKTKEIQQAREAEVTKKHSYQPKILVLVLGVVVVVIAVTLTIFLTTLESSEVGENIPEVIVTSTESVPVEIEVVSHETI